MAGITTYDELKSTIADWLDRTDLTSIIPTFIDNAESRLRRDPRVRRLVSDNFDTVDGTASYSLPSTFVSMQSLYHDGPTFYGPIEMVSANQLGQINAIRDDEKARPSHAAIIDQTTIRFAPIPNDAYTLERAYWSTIDHLSASLQSNWLLVRSPDIYLYASLVESATYLRDDPRLEVWEKEKEKRLEELHRDTQRGQFSGTLTRRVDNHIP